MAIFKPHCETLIVTLVVDIFPNNMLPIFIFLPINMSRASNDLVAMIKQYQGKYCTFRHLYSRKEWYFLLYYLQ